MTNPTDESGGLRATFPRSFPFYWRRVLIPDVHYSPGDQLPSDQYRCNLAIASALLIVATSDSDRRTREINM